MGGINPMFDSSLLPSNKKPSGWSSCLPKWCLKPNQPPIGSLHETVVSPPGGTLNPHGPELDAEVYTGLSAPAIVLKALGVLIGLHALNGVSGLGYLFKKPFNGEDEFNSSARELESAVQSLESALPDSASWSGSAADAYTSQLAVFRDQVETFSQLDSDFRKRLDRHSSLILRQHFLFYVLYPYMAGVFSIIFAKWEKAVTPAEKFQVRALACKLCFMVLDHNTGTWWTGMGLGTLLRAAVTVEIGQEAVLTSSFMRKSEARDLEAGYAEAGRRGQFSAGGSVSVSVAEVERSRMSAFGARDDSVPSVGSLLSTAYAQMPEDQQAILDGVFGKPATAALTDTSTDSGTDTDAGEDPVGGQSGFSMSVARERIQKAAERTVEISGELGKISEDLAKEISVVTQATSQVSTLSSMIQDWVPEAAAAAAPVVEAAAPVVEETAEVAEVGAAEAAAGGQAVGGQVPVQGVPVDSADQGVIPAPV